MAVVKLPRYEYDPGSGTVTIDFTSAMVDEPLFAPEWHGREAFGGKGTLQRSKDYLQEVTTLEHAFVTKAQKDAVNTMCKTHALDGKSFFFVPDRVGAPSTKHEVQLLDKAFRPKRQFKNLEFYEFALGVRLKIA